MLTLTTELTPQGIRCLHPVLGTVATIVRQADHWIVRPYKLEAYVNERCGKYKSLHAAEYHALALAYETQELNAA